MKKTYPTAQVRRFRHLSLLPEACAWIVAIIVFSACGSPKKEIQNTDRKEVLTSVTKEVIVPAFESFKVQTDSLLAATAEFTKKPELNSMDRLREQWKSTAFAWKKASAYTFGPVEDNFLAGSIDYPSVHYPNIEKSIAAGATIDEAYINSRGTSLKGLKAIEYLLFKDPDAATIVAEFNSSQPRRAYLLALVYNLNIQAQKVLDAWAPFAESFTSSGGNDIKSATGILVNKCVSQINMIKDERLVMPLGMRNQGEKQPESVEGLLSHTSIELLKNEVASVGACFAKTGDKNISTLLDQLGADYQGKPLSDAINLSFSDIDKLADEIKLPLNEAISQDPEKVKALYDSLKKLQILLEVDVVNQLGIILTFSDNDGD